MNHDPVSDADTPPIAHAEAKAGALLLLALVLAVGFVVFVMAARGVFQAQQHLVLIADNSEGVSVGMDMTFSGFAIGRVTRITLGDDGKAHLHVDVPVDHARWLRTSSVFTLERGLVGGARLRAFSGILTDPPLEEGARREVLTGDLAASLPPLLFSAQQLLDNLGEITAADGALQQSLNHLRTFSAALNGRHGALGAVLGSEAEARKLLAALDTARRLLEDARRSLQTLDAVLLDIRAVSGETREATQDLAGLRAEIDTNLRVVGGMIDELSKKWPFARQRTLELP